MKGDIGYATRIGEGTVFWISLPKQEVFAEPVRVA